MTAPLQSCVLLFLLLLESIDCAVEVNETRLHKDLFDGYNKDSHPRFPGTGPVTVAFDFQLIRILDVVSPFWSIVMRSSSFTQRGNQSELILLFVSQSARYQYIKTYAWVNQYWENSFIKWNPEDYGGVEEIHVSPDQVWVPDTLLYNNIDEEERTGGGRTAYTTNVAIRYDGGNKWLSPAMFKSICNVDITNFPFDDQECVLKFGSWAFDITKIDLAIKSNHSLNKYYIKNGEWKMLNISLKRNALAYQCCPHAFVDVSVVIKIRRESLDYILKMIIPCSLISSMIFLGFVLPPESGERIGLSITVLLALTVFQQLSSELMPSYGFPLLGQFYFAIMLEIGASLAVTTLILNFYHRNRRRMPKTMRKVILLWLARILFPCQKPKNWANNEKNTIAHWLKSDNSVDLENARDRSERDSDALYDSDVIVCHETKDSQLDSCIHAWAVAQSGCVRVAKKDPSCGPQSMCYLGAVQANNSNGRHIKFKKELQKLRRSRLFRSKDKPTRAKKVPSSNRLLRRQLANEFGMSEFEKLKNQKEWIKAARVLDRLFLTLSIIVTLVTILAIFLRAPRFHLE
ncbi:neuronal acetylcholine receptor subunit alpha-10-like isoform X4 [Acropora millepora]|nr:neuronal acetylcholine receptor subunit alpha-10-like isoform X4 [Acropora millepora]